MRKITTKLPALLLSGLTGQAVSNNKVPAGIYIYKLTATSHETNKVFSKSMKMVLLK